MNQKFLWVPMMMLSACGGGGTTEPPAAPPITAVPAKTWKAYFIDSPVSGLRWKSQSHEGYTDAQGGFLYEDVPGSTVTFSIGAVSLGTATMVNDDGTHTHRFIITPSDLTSSDAVRVNLLRTLQALSSSSEPRQGLEISRQVDTLANSWSAPDWQSPDITSYLSARIAEATQADGIPRAIPSKQQAMTHFLTSLACINAGIYTGTFTYHEFFVESSYLGYIEGLSYTSGLLDGRLYKATEDGSRGEPFGTVLGAVYNDGSGFGIALSRGILEFPDPYVARHFSGDTSIYDDYSEVYRDGIYNLSALFSDWIQLQILPVMRIVDRAGDRLLAIEVLPDNTVRAAVTSVVNGSDIAYLTGALNGDDILASGDSEWIAAPSHFTLEGKLIRSLSPVFVGTVTEQPAGGSAAPYLAFPAESPARGCIS